ncbi:MAG: hypothetical protein KIT09_15250 [Bryobacteraceae bacterium]|nr:hypothetical protein [Bryobacteraceae bacterium]
MKIALIPAIASTAFASMNCDMSAYKPQTGLTAAAQQDTLRVAWRGESREQLRVDFSIDNDGPLIRELAVQKPGGRWTLLGAGLRPEFHVTSGRRRISEQQLQPLRALGREITPELVEREKWNVFWDAPLVVPGSSRVNPDLPRRPEEIRRAASSFRPGGCAVKTDGARLEISFPGLELGIFSGRLAYTVYKDANLLRMEAIAATNEPSVAYIYRAGLRGFRSGPGARVAWRDVSRNWQKYEFGGAPNDDPVALRARNRLAILESDTGSVAFFPPPHKFFFAREIELNLGYVYYRKDEDGSLSVGVRQAEREEMFQPYGFSDDLWKRRVGQSRSFAQGNFALYNAPPGTMQRMAAYFYLSPDPAPATAARALRFTRDDRYKPLPGYQVAVSHFHTHFAEFLEDAQTLDAQPHWLAPFRSLGINIAMMSDFHSDGHPKDPGPIRLREQKRYFDGCRRHSDREFLILPGEEPDVHFGGHYTTLFPRPVYWTHVRGPEQPLVEEHPEYGKVYHAGSAADELEMLRREEGLVWQAHPRTKGSTGYPEAIKDTEYFRDDRYLGAAFQSLPVDQSERRLCDARCFSVLDDMNNWGGPKYLVSEGDTYAKYAGDDLYGSFIVNYIKLDRLPGFDEDWRPITRALRSGRFFVTSGEVLLKSVEVEGSGAQRTLVADVEWTFPLEFVEAVSGDGSAVARKEVSAADLPPFAGRTFRIPIDAGAKWVRFAAWDSAGNGAFSQPIHPR